MAHLGTVSMKCDRQCESNGGQDSHGPIGTQWLMCCVSESIWMFTHCLGENLVWNRIYLKVWQVVLCVLWQLAVTENIMPLSRLQLKSILSYGFWSASWTRQTELTACPHCAFITYQNGVISKHARVPCMLPDNVLSLSMPQWAPRHLWPTCTLEPHSSTILESQAQNRSGGTTPVWFGMYSNRNNIIHGFMQDIRNVGYKYTV